MPKITTKEDRVVNRSVGIFQRQLNFIIDNDIDLNNIVREAIDKEILFTSPKLLKNSNDKKA